MLRLVFVVSGIEEILLSQEQVPDYHRVGTLPRRTDMNNVSGKICLYKCVDIILTLCWKRVNIALDICSVVNSAFEIH